MDEQFEFDAGEAGFRFDAIRNAFVWDEELSYDPNSPWCQAIDAKIKKDDLAFLAGCCIKPEDL